VIFLTWSPAERTDILLPGMMLRELSLNNCEYPGILSPLEISLRLSLSLRANLKYPRTAETEWTNFEISGPGYLRRAVAEIEYQ
jgi:hypothetical protein